MGKSNNFFEIKKIIENIFNENKTFPDINILFLKKNWKDIIGDQLYLHTEPVKIINNLLIINCDHQGWINTLQFYKEEIIKNINNINNISNNNMIKDIKFIFKK